MVTEQPAPVETPAAETPAAAAPPPQAAIVTPTPEGSLKIAIGEYQQHRARVMGKEAPKDEPAPAVVEAPKEEAKPDAEAKPEGDKPAEDKPADAKPEEKPAAAPATSPDEVSESMSRLLRQQRAVSRREKELAAKAAAAEAEAAKRAASIAAAEKFEAAKKKDPVAAVEELLGQEVLDGTFPLDLITKLAKKTNDVPPTPDEIAEEAARKAQAAIEAKQAEERATREAAEAKERADAEKAALERREANRNAFFEGLAAQLVADADKYPYLLADPVDWQVVDTYVQSEFARTHQPPTPDVILKHFDSINEEKAKRLVAVHGKRAPAPAPKPKESPTEVVVKRPAKDTGGRPETPPAGETIRERLDRVARELNAQFGR